MLENTVKWRREFRPDQLDASEIRPEVCISKWNLCILKKV
jgi:hypothetical protein